MEFCMEQGIFIDDVQAVTEGIARLTGEPVEGLETARTFIRNEKNTKFYLDKKCGCKMQPDKDTLYLWLDSG